MVSAATAFVQEWLALVFDRGDMSSAWPLVDPPFRLASTQGWIMLNHDLPEVAAADPDQLAAALAEAYPTHPLWLDFAGWRVIRWRAVLPDLLQPEARAAVILDEPERVEPDIEVVMLTRATTPRHVEPGGRLMVQRFLVRATGAGFRIAGVGDALPRPGWPPSEVKAV